MSVTPALPYDAPRSAFEAEASELLAALGSGDPSATERFKWEHPDFVGRPVAAVERAVRAGGLDDRDARTVLARCYGFTDWADLCTFLDRLDRDPRLVRFEEAIEALIDGRVESLEKLLAADPDLVRARSPRRHRATLLHYLGANGVEEFRQRTPHNAVHIAEVLLRAGAEVDATADLYGGPCTTLTLVITSHPPAAAGVQAELAGLLLDHGAVVRSNPDEGGTTGMAEAARRALSFGYLDTARLLIERGGDVLDLEMSAGLGRVDDVRRLLPTAGAGQRHAALALGAQHGHSDIVRVLLDAGEDPNRLNPPGHHAHSTPLHQAAYSGHRDVVELLVERGARADIPDTIYGGTALGWARHAGRPEIAALLARRAAEHP